MSVIYHCKNCRNPHLSPIQVHQETAFHSLQMQSYFDGARYRCPATKASESYDFDDHSWVDEGILNKLCSHILDWLIRTGQMEESVHLLEGELLAPEPETGRPRPAQLLPPGIILKAG
ncbi:MAG: hypothetical protein KY468_07190 [Armatimonadetes bacterium]|nr:hypothetical protein [Armatimonadota bacterium]